MDGEVAVEDTEGTEDMEGMEDIEHMEVMEVMEAMEEVIKKLSFSYPGFQVFVAVTSEDTEEDGDGESNSSDLLTNKYVFIKLVLNGY